MNFLDFTFRTTARLMLLVMLVAVTTSCQQEAGSLSDKDASENNKEDMVAVTESLVRYDAMKSIDPVVTDGEKEDHVHCDISIQPEASSPSDKDASENDKEGLVVATESPVRYGATKSVDPLVTDEKIKDHIRSDITLAPVLPDPILKEIGDTYGDEDVAEYLSSAYIHIRFVSGKRIITGSMCGMASFRLYINDNGFRYDSSFEVELTNVTPDKITIIGTATVDTEVNKSKKNKYVIRTTIEAPGWEQLLNQGDLVAEGDATEELNAQIRWELQARDDTTHDN